MITKTLNSAEVLELLKSYSNTLIPQLLNDANKKIGVAKADITLAIGQASTDTLKETDVRISAAMTGLKQFMQATKVEGVVRVLHLSPSFGVVTSAKVLAAINAGQGVKEGKFTVILTSDLSTDDAGFTSPVQLPANLTDSTGANFTEIGAGDMLMYSAVSDGDLDATLVSVANNPTAEALISLSNFVKSVAAAIRADLAAFQKTVQELITAAKNEAAAAVKLVSDKLDSEVGRLGKQITDTDTLIRQDYTKADTEAKTAFDLYKVHTDAQIKALQDELSDTKTRLAQAFLYQYEVVEELGAHILSFFSQP